MADWGQFSFFAYEILMDDYEPPKYGDIIGVYCDFCGVPIYIQHPHLGFALCDRCELTKSTRV